MILKLNFPILAFNVLDKITIVKLNAHEGTNFNFLVADADEKTIDKLKPRIEQFLEQGEFIIF